MTKKKTENKRGLHVSVHDINIIEDVEFDILPGRVNVLTGAKAHGKTTAMYTILAVLGDQEKFDYLSVRRGAKLGTAQVGEKKAVIPRTGRPQVRGDSPWMPADMDSINRLITGENMKGKKARDNARVKAFSEIISPPASEEAIALLCENDTDLIEWLTEQVTAQGLDLLGAADRLRKHLYAKARHHEDLHESLQGSAKTLAQQSAEAKSVVDELTENDARLIPEEPDVEQAEQALEDSIRALESVRQSHRERARLEELQSQAREASMEEPDVDGAQKAVDQLTSDHKELLERQEELREELSRVEERVQAVSQRREDALETAEAAVQAHQRWERQQKILEQEFVGATAEDVAAAEAEVEEKRAQVKISAKAVDWQRLREESREKQKEAKKAMTQGEQFRGWGESLSDRVADALADLGVQHFEVDENRLYFVDEKHGRRDFDELSPGEQTEAAIDLGEAYAQGVMVLDSDLYVGHLDDAGRQRLDEIAKEREDRLLIVAAVGTEGELRMTEPS